MISKPLQDEIAQLKKRWKNGIVDVAHPFFLEGPGSGVLLLHGFTGSPMEVRPIGDALRQRGYTVYAPLLPGHGTIPTDLEGISSGQWIDAANQGYDKLKSRCENISVIGHSMGGALAILLAAEKKIEKLVLTAPWMKIYNKSLFPISPELKIKLFSGFVKYTGEHTTDNASDPSGQKKHFSYFHFPTSAVKEAIGMARKARAAAPGLSIPVLIIHSVNDKTIDFKGSERLFRKIASQQKEFLRLEKTNHQVFLDSESDMVISKTTDFLR